MLSKQPDPIAFMSYAHAIDTHGEVTEFHGRLVTEVQVQTGESFPVFMDRKSIQWGENWSKRITDSIDSTCFFIPVITPGFFKSEECRKELKRFLARKKKLGRNDLVLPVYYVSCAPMDDEDESAKDKLAQAVAAHQYLDWRELRCEPFTSPGVRRALVQAATQIKAAIERGGGLTKSSIALPDDTIAHDSTDPESSPQADEANEDARTGTTSVTSAKTEPPTVVVDGLHRGDYTTISSAIAAAAPGTRILIRPGLYKENLVIDKPLEVIGHGDMGDIVVEAKGADVLLFKATMGRVANLTMRQAGGGKWYGVDITQGRLELGDCDITSGALACVAVHDGADPRLRRNRIHDSAQGGIIVYNGGLGVFEDNEIFRNAYSGVAIQTRGNPVMRRNLIRDGRVSGILVSDGGLGTIEDNDIVGNSFSGVEIRTSGAPVLCRNHIRGGRYSGVFVHDQGTGTLEDNDIYKNSSSGLMVESGGSPIVCANRIKGNRYQGVTIRDGGSGVFEDNDLRDNAKGAWYIAADCEQNVTRARNQE